MTSVDPSCLKQRTTVVVDKELEDLIPGYLEHRRKDVIMIREALDAGDYETIRGMGHKMKGSGGGYGFERISEIGKALEDAGRNGDPEAIRSETAALELYLDTLDIVCES